MALKTCVSLGCLLLIASSGLQTAISKAGAAKRMEEANIKALVRDAGDLRTIGRAGAKSASSRSDAESRRVSPFRLLLGKPRVSPLYLINGTVCRFVNFQPICTTLSTTGLTGKRQLRLVLDGNQLA